jgi:hypothetical protein
MTESTSLSSMLKIIRSRRMPALFTTTCSAPNVSIAWRTMRSAAFQSETLSVLATASPPAPRSRRRPARRSGVGAGAVVAAAEVVHDHLRAVLREQQRLFAADAAAGPRDDRHASVEQSHG